MMKGCLYCVRCDKSIPKEELEERAKRLFEMFGDRSLASGRCPVCGTTLIDMDEVEKKRKAGG
jgi:predicted nucleic acid-binding Zn ribbon protein